MELRPEDVSLSSFRGCYVQVSMKLGPEDAQLYTGFNGVGSEDVIGYNA